ncbi:MAG TPA: cofactor-independent phosphoglycerate mutase [Clostridiales bacterium]|nr:cofactor-independent phosphoglycerate mutase [Clostridiales bacterium]
MKHVIILLDGMADYPIPDLYGKTPLGYANTPNMDRMFQKGTGGMVKNVPDSLAPGSAVANLSVLGYNPEKYFTGRSPIEAASMGVSLKDTDIAARCNLVTLSDEPVYEDKTLIDYCSDEISTQEAKVLIEALNKEMNMEGMLFYPGISYRRLFVWSNGPSDMLLTPPHDITGKNINNRLPSHPVALEVMKKSHEILKKHPVNMARLEKGLNPANSAWFWGAGKKTVLPNFESKYGKKGAVISAVDLVQGIGVCADMAVIKVEGATGNFHTNYQGKAQACIQALKDGYDFVFVHIEAPDECGHRNEMMNKVRSIELIDEKIIGPVISELEGYDDYKIMALADHPTPLSLRTHTRDAVPFVIYQKGDVGNNQTNFTEETASKTGIFYEKGTLLADAFMK